MQILSFITVAVLSLTSPTHQTTIPSTERPTTTAQVRAVCKDQCPEAVANVINEIQDQLFYQQWLRWKKFTVGDAFNPNQYLFDRLSQIDTMVACESVCFAIQRSIYEHPNDDKKAVVANASLEDAFAYQLMRVVSTDILSALTLERVQAAKEKGDRYSKIQHLETMVNDSFRAAVARRLGGAKVVYTTPPKDEEFKQNLAGEGFQKAYDKILAILQKIEARGGTVTVYFNFMSPPIPTQIAIVSHSILAQISPPHFHLYDMDAQGWIVTYGNGDGEYPNTEVLLKNALDYIRIAYLQPNVGNMETALQLVVYSDVE